MPLHSGCPAAVGVVEGGLVCTRLWSTQGQRTLCHIRLHGKASQCIKGQKSNVVAKELNEKKLELKTTPGMARRRLIRVT